MYKTSTFLTSLFSKFNVRNKEVRKQIVELYKPVIDAILSDVPIEKRVIVFKELLPSIRLTILYLNKLHLASQSNVLSRRAFEALKSSTAFNCYLIKKVGIRSDSPGTTFSDIMKQVNLSDIVCDIGDCIKVLKTSKNKKILSGIDAQLQVLLSDYNVVTGQNLTVADIIER